MAQHGKKYKESLDKVDRLQLYAVGDAVDLVKELASAKFDETVELAVRQLLDQVHRVAYGVELQAVDLVQALLVLLPVLRHGFFSPRVLEPPSRRQ